MCGGCGTVVYLCSGGGGGGCSVVRCTGVGRCSQAVRAAFCCAVAAPPHLLCNASTASRAFIPGPSPTKQDDTTSAGALLKSSSSTLSRVGQAVASSGGCVLSSFSARLAGRRGGELGAMHSLMCAAAASVMGSGKPEPAMAAPMLWGRSAQAAIRRSQGVSILNCSDQPPSATHSCCWCQATPQFGSHILTFSSCLQALVSVPSLHSLPAAAACQILLRRLSSSKCT